MIRLLKAPNPTAVRAVDLSRPLYGLTDVQDYTGVRVFVTVEGCLLGSVYIANHRQPVGIARLREAIVNTLGFKLLEVAVAEHYMPNEAGTATLPADVLASVVVATYDRPDDLRECLQCLKAQVSLRRVEIVVVDNNPMSGLTPRVVAEFPGVVLVNEERKGMAYARNKGFVASSGEIIATVDDDIKTPPDWLEKLLAPFRGQDVMAVTGNILPMELKTNTQHLFEAYGGLRRGFRRREVNGDWFDGFRAAVPTWTLGATANAAFRASIFAHPQIGLMDEALGDGTPTGCSEDTYLFYKILKAGYSLVYEPNAHVWHEHHGDIQALRRQIYNYSKGHVAYHLTTLIRDHDLRALVQLMIKLPHTYIRRAKERLRGRSIYPLSLIMLEIVGNLAGPFALWKSRRRVKRDGLSPTYIPVSCRSTPTEEPMLPTVHQARVGDVSVSAARIQPFIT